LASRLTYYLIIKRKSYKIRFDFQLMITCSLYKGMAIIYRTKGKFERVEGHDGAIVINLPIIMIQRGMGRVFIARKN
jgi:hypothetical protein